MSETGSPAPKRLYEAVARHAEASKAFAGVEVTGAMLRCQARDVEEAYYAVSAEAGKIWVGLYTPDRWLSESIEADALHQGDKFEDLIDEELAEQGVEDITVTVEHFRNDAKVFVFRSPVPVRDPQTPTEAEVHAVAGMLLAYQAAFRELGDMSPEDELV